jgi:hypothetical protein
MYIGTAFYEIDITVMKEIFWGQPQEFQQIETFLGTTGGGGNYYHGRTHIMS